MINTLKKSMIVLGTVIVMMVLTIIPAEDGITTTQQYSSTPVIETQEPTIGEDGDSLFDTNVEEEPEIGSGDNLFNE